MKIKKVLLDLDDVCNDFTLHALRHVGCDINVNDFSVYNPKWGFDILGAARVLGRNLTLPEFWGKFKAVDWSSMPTSHEFHILLEVVLKITDPENILICTAPICGPRIKSYMTAECMAGKFRWILNHFPSEFHRQFSMTPMKHFCATPETLLIDDCDDNVNEFRKASGQAILMPRPWNTAHEFSLTQGEIYGYLTDKFAKVLS